MLPRNQAKKKFNQTHFFNNQFRNFSNNFTNNQMRNELTINVTKNEPRLVILNQPKPNLNFHATHLSHGHPPQFSQSRPQAIPNFKHHKQNNQSHSYQKTYTNTNRYKFINNQTNKLKAPYNTTQYLMYDYSRRRGPKDQQCPDEQQQFTNDWNLALNQSEQNEEPKFTIFCAKTQQNEDNMEHDGEQDNIEQHQQQNYHRLKKSLSDLDLASEHDMSHFFSTSI